MYPHTIFNVQMIIFFPCLQRALLYLPCVYMVLHSPVKRFTFGLLFLFVFSIDYSGHIVFRQTKFKKIYLLLHSFFRLQGYHHSDMYKQCHQYFCWLRHLFCHWFHGT